MQLKLHSGSIYKFVIGNGLEHFNGIYKVAKVVTYDEFLLNGRNLLTDLYTPVGKDEDDLDNDLATIKSYDIFKLVSPDWMDTKDNIYIPACFVEEITEHNVKEYMKLGLICNLGIIDNKSTIDYKQSNIMQQCTATIGINPQTRFMTTGSVWLTDEDYAEEVAKRDEELKTTINYFSENKPLCTELDQANTRLQLYQEKIQEFLTSNQTLHEQVTSLGGLETDG